MEKKKSERRSRRSFFLPSTRLHENFLIASLTHFSRTGANLQKWDFPSTRRFQPLSFLPSAPCTAPRFRDSFVAKKLNSRDAQHPRVRPPSSPLSPFSAPPPPFSTAVQFFGVGYGSIVRQFLHMPTAEVTRPLLLFSAPSRTSVGRYTPRNDQTANLSIERMAWPRNRRTVRCIPRAPL